MHVKHSVEMPFSVVGKCYAVALSRYATRLRARTHGYGLRTTQFFFILLFGLRNILVLSTEIVTFERLSDFNQTPKEKN